MPRRGEAAPLRCDVECDEQPRELRRLPSSLSSSLAHGHPFFLIGTTSPPLEIRPSPGGFGPKRPQYTVSMATVEISEKHQELVDGLLDAVAAYNPAVDRDLIARAFRFAAKAHEGQVRRSGQEFIHHPLGVAR